MKKHTMLFLGLGIGFLIGIVALFIFFEKVRAPEGENILTATHGSCGPVPEPLEVRPNQNIVVDMWRNTNISQNFTVMGKARVFENQFTIQVLNAKGVVVKEAHVYAHAPDVGQFGQFTAEFDLGRMYEPCTKFIIEAFDYSAKDGSKQDIVTVPVFFGTLGA